MDGILILDKPADWTSHDVVAKLRGALKIKRIGHGGTLDPMATGVLPVFVGRATRVAEFSENADKVYIAGLKLGLTTDTHDITGRTLETRHAEVRADDLRNAIPHFLGVQEQIPPMFSAVKVGGKKLYELARRGIEVQRPPRNIHIYDISLLDGGANEFSIKVTCSKGTYIRTLCHDIGNFLGCGGVMSSLRRIRAGVYTVETSLTLTEALESISRGTVNKYLIPIDSVFKNYPPLTLSAADTQKCKYGSLRRISGSVDGIYRFYGPDNEFLALSEITDGTVRVLKSFYLN